jgi:hypothetical protein
MIAHERSENRRRSARTKRATQPLLAIKPATPPEKAGSWAWASRRR